MIKKVYYLKSNEYVGLECNSKLQRIVLSLIMKLFWIHTNKYEDPKGKTVYLNNVEFRPGDRKKNKNRANAIVK